MNVNKYTSYSIDVTRGLAALGVIYGHSMYGLGLPIELNGAFWVWIFLVISGYLVGHGFFHGKYASHPFGYIRFLWNRALRIVPLAWLALLLGAAIEALSKTQLPKNTWDQFLFMPPLNDMSLVGPLWTIAAEMQFYVVSVLVCSLLLAGKKIKALGVLIVLLGMLCLWITNPLIAWLGDNSAQPRTLAGNSVFFLIGVLLSMRALPPFGCSMLAKVTLAAGIVCVAWWLQNFKPDYFWHWRYQSWPFGGGAACAIAFSILILWTKPKANGISVNSSRLIKRLAARISGLFGQGGAALAWCGFYTYGIYVFHALLGKANGTFLNLPTGLQSMIWLLVSLILAPISYRYLERPFLRLKSASGAET